MWLSVCAIFVNISNTCNVEDEQHFLLVCDAYREERNKFKCILNDNWKAGLNYILESWIKRKEIAYVLIFVSRPWHTLILFISIYYVFLYCIDIDRICDNNK